MISDFRVHRRNIGHWDIVDHNQRLFRIRGGPGKYWVADERNLGTKKTYGFKSMALAMAFICDELMFELIIAEGQEPKKIEAWNV